MKKGRFKDKRGLIEDLLVSKDHSVTYVSFKKDAIRGNHYHKKTEQIDIVLTGSLICVTDDSGFVSKTILGPGSIVVHEPGVRHAYEATEDSEIVSVCMGVRVGKNYKKDTFKLDTPLL
jgi:Uncharacterized conserved protein, contains double-stranded beta-helix domain